MGSDRSSRAEVLVFQKLFQSLVAAKKTTTKTKKKNKKKQDIHKDNLIWLGKLCGKK